MYDSKQEKGFVLATSLVLLLLLTMLSIAVYFSVQVSQKTSASAESATEAFYYAETAINYVAWALKNDAEFDSYIYPQAVKDNGDTSFLEPENRSALPDPTMVGDRSEWFSNMGNPSGEDSVDGTFDANSHFGQVMYYDNRPPDQRNGLFWPDAKVNPPQMFEIAGRLPRYIKLEIDEYGNITPSLPVYYPNRSTTHDLPAQPLTAADANASIPYNGAVVWLTGGDQNTDRYMFPIDLYAAPFLDLYSNSVVTTHTRPQGANVASDVWANWQDAYGAVIPMQDGLGRSYPFPTPVVGGYYDQVPCDIYALDQSSPPSVSNPQRIFNNNQAVQDLYTQVVACDGNSQTWLVSGEYGLVAYAIGYVNGKARKMIRTVLFF